MLKPLPSHPLDRPVWNALNANWSALAVGDRRALRIAPDFGPFGAAADESDASRTALAALAPSDGELWIVEHAPFVPPTGVQLLRSAQLAQMSATTLTPSTAPTPSVEILNDADGAEMRALALMTKPGPFHEHTHQLGRFIGIREEGRLVAMAGERMRLPGFAEVSGVCTHPDHRGKGYAKALMRLVAQAMLDRGETPFLHAYADHAATIALYETLGFTVRAQMWVTVLGR
ncbi:GNAT family N-acetyltransferase [Sphingobium aromaticiconvertens]|uniref:GNAT family N-acetyltransferase n=1 Tax=Sphingobium aromaticiconvertens TaxID=365341 RepID=UPI003017AF4C